MAVSRAAAVAFVTAFVTLCVQVLVHRAVSLKLVNNYAFMVISLTMLGFALSGVVLARWAQTFLRRLGDTLVAAAALFAITTVAATAVFYHAATAVYLTQTRAEFFDAFWRTMPLALLFAVPFAFAGVILGVLLSSPSLPAGRIYCWDLVGSAAGALLVIPAIQRAGVEVSLLLACALGVLVPLVLVRSGRSARLLALAALALVALAGVGRDRVFRMTYPDGSMLALAQAPGSGSRVEYGAWDPLAHIEVVRIRPPDARQSNYPVLLGNNPAHWARIHLMLTQNNWAFTLAPRYEGSRASLTGIEQTIFAAPYQASRVAAPRVFVIGVGGGSDVLAALAFDASSVVAAEVNGATVGVVRSAYREYFRSWVDDPRVRLVNAEGRSLLAATPGAFDVITVSGVDTYSGTPAAAHVFSENYLYTDEAFDLYLRRLSPRGILSVQRMEHLPPREMLRALTSATASLRRAGVERPAEHVLMATMVNGRFTVMLVQKAPFDPEATSRFAAWATSTEYLAISAGPGINASRANPYQVFLGLGSAERERAFADLYPFDISPVSDDRPFFLHFSFWWHVLSDDGVVRRSIPAMQYSVLLLLAIVGVAVLVCVVGPLWVLGDRGSRTSGRGRYAVFFAAIGLGYMMIELALVQKFGLFLGHPNYALSVVLASLLLGTGMGAVLSDRLVPTTGRLRVAALALTVLVFLEQSFVAPWLLALPPLPVAVRTALVAGIVIPLGVCLGLYMPFGLDRLKRANSALAPWAWGVNGVFSVLAPIAGMAVSMTWGISALLLAALPAYLVAALILSDPAAPPV